MIIQREDVAVDLAVMDKYVNDGLITKRKHDTEDLYIYNYTPACQYGGNWDDITTQARGLITDASGNVVARPFRKFFNLEEITEPLPNESFQIAEKLDGSLGIMYPLDGGYAIATRGSFVSDQAAKGTSMLQAYMAEHGTGWIDPACTYLFEIIFKENRIVVDYGDAERLVLLAVINTETGEELDIQDVDYPDKARLFDAPKALEDMRKDPVDNAEGYVVRFQSGLRIKMKFAEYVRLHRILTGISSTTIWETLAVEEMAKMFHEITPKIIGGSILYIDQRKIEPIMSKKGKAFQDMLDNVPDEFYGWISSQIDDMRSKHDAAIYKAIDVLSKTTDRRRIIELCQSDKQTRSIAFGLLDGKLPMAHGLAWRAAKPEYSKAFAKDADV